MWHVEERQLKKSRPPSRTSRRRYRDVPPLPRSPARVDWTIEASRLLRRRPPALGTSVCTCSTPTPSRAEAADWRRRCKSPTRPSSSGEGWDHVYYVPTSDPPRAAAWLHACGLLFQSQSHTPTYSAHARLRGCTGRVSARVGRRVGVPQVAGSLGLYSLRVP